MKNKTIKAGTLLYHGTDSPDDFTVPTGPAWFTFDWQTAAKWAGWTKGNPGDPKGPRRLLTLRLTQDVVLRDTADYDDWVQLCEEVMDDPDPCLWTIARIMKEQGRPGWYGKKEIMLTDTTTLQHCDTNPVPPNVKSFGD